jgi:hypothetical protein
MFQLQPNLSSGDIFGGGLDQYYTSVPPRGAAMQVYNTAECCHRETLLCMNSGRMRMYAIHSIAIQSVDGDESMIIRSVAQHLS